VCEACFFFINFFIIILYYIYILYYIIFIYLLNSLLILSLPISLLVLTLKFNYRILRLHSGCASPQSVAVWVVTAPEAFVRARILIVSLKEGSTNT